MFHSQSLLLAIILLVGAFCSTPAFAHAFPDQTVPLAGSVLKESPAQVAVHFDHQFNPALTKVRVLNEQGDLVSSPGMPSVDDHTLTVPVKPLGNGQYFVKWSAMSQDGDRTMGAYSFTVKGAPH